MESRKKAITRTFSLFAIGLTVVLTSCNYQSYLLDTSSSSIYEYQNDFYVSNADSLVELHYNLWSNRASIWLSALNLTDDLIFYITDSCYVEFQGERYPYDLSQETQEYIMEITKIPNLENYDLGRYFPVPSGKWKGFVGAPLPFSFKELEQFASTHTYDRESSPLQFVSQVCFFRGNAAYSPYCARDTIWVEEVRLLDNAELRAIELDKDYKKSDKFYVGPEEGYY